MTWVRKSCTGITSWRAGESFLRGDRAALPASSHGKVKGKGTVRMQQQGT